MSSVQMLEERFRDTINKFKLLKKKERLLLAVSGGPDSVCMLHLFRHIQRAQRLHLVCVHFNHSLRDDADSEEEFVAFLCKRLDIQCVSTKRDTRKFFKGDSLEQTARRLRFEFFLSCARRLKIKKIALAHNKDDVAETVLMRIIRGAALRGLRAILPSSKYRGVALIRPLITMRKKEIVDWLSENNILFKIDKSNYEEKFFRNKVRHTLLPLLETEFNPNITGTLFNLARLSAADYDFIYTVALKEFYALRKTGRHSLQLNLERLKKLHVALRAGIIRIAIEETKGDLRRFELKHLDEILDLIDRRPDASIVHLPSVEVRKIDNSLIISSLPKSR